MNVINSGLTLVKRDHIRDGGIESASRFNPGGPESLSIFDPPDQNLPGPDQL